MRILLLGEFSGFYKNLKEGLIELGHEVDIATTGDGFKQVTNSNLYVPDSKNKVIRVFRKLMFSGFKIKQYYGYDIVQMVSHNIYGGLKFGYNGNIIKRISENNTKTFLSVAGDHYYIYKVSEKLRYSVYGDSEKGKSKCKDINYIANNDLIVDLVDGIIPVMYTYAEAYRNHSKLLSTIPLPINSNKISFIPQKIQNNKLKIFHGLNRENEKGTKYIREAMEKLKKKYPNDVEIIIEGKMPLEKYLKVLEETNIVIDQALVYEYGMNALYAMAMGKVVLSGNEPECQEEFGRTDIPIINITPSVDDIYNKLEKLVLDKKSIQDIGYRSRKFVEDFHDHVKVAQQYIDTWNSIGVRK